MRILSPFGKAPLFAPETDIGSSSQRNPETDLSGTESGEFSPSVASVDAAAPPDIDPALDVPPASVSEAALRAKQFRDSASERWHAVGERAKEMNVAAQDRIRQSPTKAVFGALGLGLLVGLVMKRASA